MAMSVHLIFTLLSGNKISTEYSTLLFSVYNIHIHPYSCLSGWMSDIIMTASPWAYLISPSPLAQSPEHYYHCQRRRKDIYRVSTRTIMRWEMVPRVGCIGYL